MLCFGCAFVKPRSISIQCNSYERKPEHAFTIIYGLWVNQTWHTHDDHKNEPLISNNASYQRALAKKAQPLKVNFVHLVFLWNNLEKPSEIQLEIESPKS